MSSTAVEGKEEKSVNCKTQKYKLSDWCNREKADRKKK